MDFTDKLVLVTGSSRGIDSPSIHANPPEIGAQESSRYRVRSPGPVHCLQAVGPRVRTTDGETEM